MWSPAEGLLGDGEDKKSKYVSKLRTCISFIANVVNTCTYNNIPIVATEYSPEWLYRVVVLCRVYILMIAPGALEV